MQISTEQLGNHLRRGLASLYLVYGDEALLVREAVDAIREKAQAQGYAERQLMSVEPGFDWNGLIASSRSLSLFSERRLLELRLPTGKPGEAGAKALAELAADPPADTLLLVVCGKLDKAVRASRWVEAIESVGVAVAAYPIETAQLPGWIARRLQAKGLKPGPGVAQLLAYHMEGNLLACDQEIEKLALLHGPSEINVGDIEGALSDSARFTVFGLADAALKGEARAAARILESLRAEGVEPVLVLWALAREIRELARLAARVAAGEPEERALEAGKVWSRRRPLVKQALKRLKAPEWFGFLRQAARVDRVIKGRAHGDAWRELQALALAVAGLKTPGLRVSGFESPVSS